MHVTSRNSKAAFTLIELLAVVGIISLLIGILVPAVAAARYQAKAAATRSKLSSINSGCEMFNGETNRYPVSQGWNPFEQTQDVALSGAQWLVLQVSGPDFMGYVKPITDNDSDPPDGIINYEDWRDWYSTTPGADYSRSGPYVTADGNFAQTPTQYKKSHGFVAQIPNQLTLGSSDWDNQSLPFFVDNFGYPILYYAASAYAKEPVSTGTDTNLVIGCYDQSDNAAFTGGQGGNGFLAGAQDGWDLGSGPDASVPPYFHPLAMLGYNAADPADLPPKQSFMHAIYDRNLYESTDKGSGGRVWPLRAKTFLLVSPGRDARYGTMDDIWNF
ncbi:MAG: type II secretion system protein [Phycisphaerae bacterium]|jgi:prepilin-type N-terminal cleavage/methylation domain-containing protein